MLIAKDLFHSDALKDSIQTLSEDLDISWLARNFGRILEVKLWNAGLVGYETIDMLPMILVAGEWRVMSHI